MPQKKKDFKVILYTGFHDTAIFYSVVSPPLGLYRLKNYLTSRNMSCDVFDLGLSDGDFKDSLDKMIKREGKTELYNNCLKFLKTRIKLDQNGYTDDIFSHH